MTQSKSDVQVKVDIHNGRTKTISQAAYKDCYQFIYLFIFSNQITKSKESNIGIPQ